MAKIYTLENGKILVQPVVAPKTVVDIPTIKAEIAAYDKQMIQIQESRQFLVNELVDIATQLPETVAQVSDIADVKSGLQVQVAPVDLATP